MKLTETHKFDAAALSVIGFFICSLFFSFGYLQADEHFQIIEFGYYFLGENEPSELAWEFQDRIRPGLQPIIAAGIIRFNSLFDESSIYSITLSLRFITMILSLITLLKFANSQRTRFENIGTFYYYFISLGLWFIVFFSFRFSSETWGGLLFLLGLTFYFEKRSFWLVGLLFGLSFLFRFQVAFLILGFVLNLLIYKRESLKSILRLSLAFLFVFLFGTLMDTWFYGVFTISSWNYFEFNILAGGASSFGELPIYYYFLFLFKKPFILIGVLILLSFILNLKDYKNPIIWAVVFFLFFHSIVAHKESRFLIPIGFLAPYFLFNSLKILNERLKKSSFNKWVLLVVVVLNAAPLFVVSFKSAGPGYAYLGKLIHEKYEDKNIVIYSLPYSNPYYHWDRKLRNHRDVLNTGHHFMANVEDVSIDLFDQQKVNLFTVREKEHDYFKNSQFYQDFNLKFISSSHPQWILNVLKLYNGFEYFEVVHLYELVLEREG
jgi:phosphatidylinositol glycan class B